MISSFLLLLFTHLHYFSFFFFNDTATTEIYTLSLHDALPISSPAFHDGNPRHASPSRPSQRRVHQAHQWPTVERKDRKSTRLNSSHSQISYAVFCLKKKKKNYSRQLHNSSIHITHTSS